MGASQSSKLTLQSAAPITPSFWSQVDWKVWVAAALAILLLIGLAWYFLRTPSSSAPAGASSGIIGDVKETSTKIFPVGQMIALQNRQTGKFLIVVSQDKAVAGTAARAEAGVVIEATAATSDDPHARWIVRAFNLYEGAFRLENVGAPGVYLRSVEVNNQVLWEPGVGQERSNLFAAPTSSFGSEFPSDYVVIIGSNIAYTKNVSQITKESTFTLAVNDTGAISAEAVQVSSPLAQWKVVPLGPAPVEQDTGTPATTPTV